MAVFALVAAACGSDDPPATTDSAPDATEPAVAETEAAESEATESEATEPTTEPVATEATDDGGSDAAEPGATEPEATDDGDGESADTGPDRKEAFPELGPPTGEPMRIGLVNTEGTPGLDFPDLRLIVESGVEYLNQHGGIGGRPIELRTCVAAGSPETSRRAAKSSSGQTSSS